MEEEEIQKNKYDMYYQIYSSAALKCAGLAITIPLAVLGLSVETEIDLFSVGFIAFSIFGYSALIFFTVANNYINRIEGLKD